MPKKLEKCPCCKGSGIRPEHHSILEPCSDPESHKLSEEEIQEAIRKGEEDFRRASSVHPALRLSGIFYK